MSPEGRTRAHLSCTDLARLDIVVAVPCQEALDREAQPHGHSNHFADTDVTNQQVL